MKKILFSLFAALLMVSPSTMAETLLVNDDTSTSIYVPYYGNWGDAYQHSQVIYPASLLADMDGKSITSMTFYFKTAPKAQWTATFTIGLAEVTATGFSGNAWNNASLTTVYSSTVTVDIAGKTMTVEFETPYSYAGGNLLFDLTTTAGNYKDATFYGDATAYQSVMGYSSTSLASVSPTRRQFAPKTTFAYEAGSASTCAKPGVPVASAVTSSTATLTWDAAEDVTNYQYCVVAGGADADWTAAAPVSATSANLTGLDANTDYDFFVRSYCGAEDQSKATKVSFTTACDAVTVTSELPYVNGFESETSGQYPQCFTIDNNGGTKPTVSKNSTYTTYSHSGSYCLNYGGSAGENKVSYVSLPEFTNDVKTLQMEFWLCGYANYATRNDKFVVGVMTDPTDATTFTVVSDEYQVASTYTKVEVDFSNYVGNGHYIAIKRTPVAYSGYYYYGSYLDDITVKVASACKKPSAPAISNLTSDGATFSWTAASGAEGYQYVAVESGTTPSWSGAQTTTETSVVLTGLESSTTYDVYVRTVRSECESEAVSASFTTLCGAVTISAEAPYFNDFKDEAYGEDPACFTLIKNGSDYPTVRGSNYDCYSSYYYLSFGGYTGSNYESYAVLPAVTNDVKTLQMSFYLKGYSATASLNDKFVVGVMTSADDAASFVPVSEEFQVANTYTLCETDFAAYTGTGRYIALKRIPVMDGARSHGSYLDAITVSLAPTCIKPKNLAASDITKTTAVITWTAGAEESQWEVEYKSAAAATWTAVSGQLSEAQCSLDNLTASTIYKVRVRAYCGAEDQSEWSDEYTFVTECGEMVLGTTFDFEEDTENAAPLCWTVGRESASATAPYVINDFSLAHAGYQSLSIGYSYAYHSRAWAAMPKVADDVDVRTLKVSAHAYNFNKASDVALRVGVMTDPSDLSTFEECATLRVDRDRTSAVRTVYLDKCTNGGKYVAFVVDNSAAEGAYTLYLDDVTVSAEVEENVSIRTISSANPGTICLARDAKNLTGASFFEISWTSGDRLYVDQLAEPATLEAGRGYIYVPEAGATEITGSLYGETKNVALDAFNGLQGTLSDIAAAEENVLVGNYMLSGGKVVLCGANCWLNAGRAYIIMGAVPTTNPGAPAPGRRRVAFATDGTNTTTGIDAVTHATENHVGAAKYLINGNLYIVREGKMYNAAGQLVK